MHLLTNWLKKDVGLEHDLDDSTSLESAFSNGYLFGEIFSLLRQQDNLDQFINDDTRDAKIKNYALLEQTFRSLGISLSAQKAKEMMDGEKGVAGDILYQIRMAFDNVSYGDPTQKIRVPRPIYDNQKKNFFDARLRAMSVSSAQVAEERLLNKFSQERINQEAMANELDELDQVRIKEQRDLNRTVLREKMDRMRKFKEQWDNNGITDWKDNVAYQRAREHKERLFKKRMRDTRTTHQIDSQKAAKKEVADGIAEFEKMLGLDEDEQVTQEGSLSSTEPIKKGAAKVTQQQYDQEFGGQSKAETYDEFVQELEAKQELDDQETRAQAANFLARIKG